MAFSPALILLIFGLNECLLNHIFTVEYVGLSLGLNFRPAKLTLKNYECV